MKNTRLHSRPRKIITRAIVFLLLGAIVNVAVAWACAVFVNVYVFNAIGRRAHWSSNDEEWRAYERTRFGAYALHSRRSWSETGLSAHSEGLHPRDIVPESSPLRKPKPSHYLLWKRGAQPLIVSADGSVDIDAYTNSGWIATLLEARTADFRGWPMLALSCELIAKGYVGNVAVEGGIKTSLDPFHLAQDVIPKALPIRPIWPGFAINTIFYATILWLLLAAPGTVRRRRRIKRGLCPACAYPIGAASNCTECGKPVQPRPRGGDGM